MEKHVKVKKIFVYATLVIFTGTITTCTSRAVLYTGGPFSQKLLQQNNLITEKTYNNLHIRIVYPGTISDPQQRQLIEQYIQTFPEKRIFDDSISTEELNNEMLNTNEEHYLAIYGYIMAYRVKIVSLVFQVQYWTNKSKKTERWYTLNYDRSTQAIISFNSLFKDFALANAELEQYITQEIMRQDELNISTENKKTLSLKNTIHNFSFIPSKRYRKKFIGLQIYINTDEESTDELLPKIANKNYAIRIPYSFIEPYIIKKVQTYFTKVPFSYKNEENISKKHMLVFPDLRDNKF